eukprot:scaffold20361_cov102-Isochrysis_galbana.AAC.2
MRCLRLHGMPMLYNFYGLACSRSTSQLSIETVSLALYCSCIAVKRIMSWSWRLRLGAVGRTQTRQRPTATSLAGDGTIRGVATHIYAPD